MSRFAGAPDLVHAIKRTRRTPIRGGLLADTPRHHVAGAFTFIKCACAPIQGRRGLRSDDMLTTDAAISVVTGALMQAGAENVGGVLVLARVVQENDIPI